MASINIKTNVPYPRRKNRSKNQDQYESSLLHCFEHLFMYVRAKRDIELIHRKNRNRARNTNQNTIISATTIIDLMNDFLSKKGFMETYFVPQDLLFIRKFHRTYYDQSIKLTTLYSSFKSLNTTKFQKLYPAITFNTIAAGISVSHGIPVTSKELIRDYDTIVTFLSAYRSSTA